MKTITLGKKEFSISLRILNIVMLIISGGLAVALLIINHHSAAYYEQVQLSTERYQACGSSADRLQQASTLLTNEARGFVVTGDDNYIENYFSEIETQKNREEAVQTLQQYYQNSQLNLYLERALRISNELAAIEIKAMRLAAEGYGYDLSGYSREIQKVTLSDEESALDAEDKLLLAQTMMFDKNYQSYQQKISQNLSSFFDSLNDVILAQQTESSERFARMLRAQQILTIALLVSTLATVLLVAFLILRPLQKTAQSILKSQKLSVSGMHEMKILADSYNQMLEKSQEDHRQLSYEANHDSLTGVNNRTVFDRICADPAFSSERLAMMLIDIDFFKEINDTYGHGTGDRVLQRLASLLLSGFRSSDSICRIGGDEFAVFLFGIAHDQKELIRNKIGSITNQLAHPVTDDVPPVTLSVGVAFGEQNCKIKDLYKNADIALYRVKNSGKNGLKFY